MWLQSRGPHFQLLSPGSHHLHMSQLGLGVVCEVPARLGPSPHLLTAWRKCGRKLWLPASSRLGLLPDGGSSHGVLLAHVQAFRGGLALLVKVLRGTRRARLGGAEHRPGAPRAVGEG